MREPRSRRLLVGALLVIVGPSLVAAEPDDDRMTESMHGATSMKEQLADLERLLAGRDPLAPPSGMDPVLWASYIPADNPMTMERVELGKKLYFDVRLSSDDTVSCATCHDVRRGFTDQRMVSEGVGDALGRRNAPTTLNAALFEPMFLDGRAKNVEEQALLPILNPIEMGFTDEGTVVKKLQSIPEYPPLFRQAFGRELTYEDIGRAIGSFERTLIFLDAPFDRFLAGDTSAISEAAARGFELFNGQARCVSCHPLNQANPLGTNFNFHNIGVAARTQDFEALARDALKALAQDDSEQRIDELALNTDFSEMGRFLITRNRSDIGAFRTSQLRNIGITGPYMHDGSMQTLFDVVDHYNKGGEANPFLDGGIEPLALTEAQIADLVEFMFTLTDVRFADQNARELEKQRARAVTTRPFRDEALAMRRKISFEDRVMKGANR